MVTDPPYLVSAGAGGGLFGQHAALVNTGGFTDGGVDYGFLDGVDNWFVCCSLKQLPELTALAKQKPRWNLITWCKPNPVPTCCNKYLPDVEYVVHGFTKGRLFGDMPVKSSFAVIPCGNKQTEHPNEKPMRLMTKLITLGSMAGELVVDPFMGSGTTLLAAKMAGRRAIGIERDEAWCEVAAKRLSQECLFAPPPRIAPTPPEQFALLTS